MAKCFLWDNQECISMEGICCLKLVGENWIILSQCLMQRKMHFFKERSWKIIGKFPVPVELNDSLNTTVRHLHLVWFQRYPIPWIIEQWKCSTWNTKAFLKEKCAFQGGRRFSWFCHQTLLRNFLIEISLYQVLHFTLIAKIKPNRQNTYQKFLDEVLSSFLEAGKN